MEMNIKRKDCQVCLNRFCIKRNETTNCKECETELERELNLIDKKLENN